MKTIKRILLVDDNEADNVFHEIILRRAGFVGAVTVCESAQSALDYLWRNQNQLPDLVLVDINMPGMDGFKFAEQVAVHFEVRAPKLMMLTSSNAQCDRERAERLTAIAGYIVKPLKVDVAQSLLAGNDVSKN